MEEVFGIILSAFFGAIFGSYATLFAYRLGNKESCFGRFFGPKSRCPKCHRIIRTRELIPLINWLITLGRCKNCNTKIPRTHLFIELTTTISFVFCYLKFGFNEIFILYSLICVSLIVLLVINYTHKTLNNSVLNFILILGVANRVLNEQTIMGIIYSVVCGVICATIFYQLFFVYIKNLLTNQDQAFDCIKFIMLSSVVLQQNTFIYYFLLVTMIFATLSFFDIVNKRKHRSLGYILILPFWALFIQPPLFLIN